MQTRTRMAKKCHNHKPAHVTYSRWYCKSGNFREGYFRETSYMRSFVKIKSSRNDEIYLSFTDIGKSCPSREFYTSQICLLTPFAKIKFSRKFPDLQYKNTDKHRRTNKSSWDDCKTRNNIDNYITKPWQTPHTSLEQQEAMNQQQNHYLRHNQGVGLGIRVFNYRNGSNPANQLRYTCTTS